MSQASTENKPFERLHPPVMFGEIEEHLSRLCRYEIFDALYSSLEEEIRIEKNYRRRNGIRVDRSYTVNTFLANELGVSYQTIWRWKRAFVGEKKIDYVSNNINSKKLVEKAIRYIPDKLAELIKEDLDRYWVEYYRILADTDNETYHGGVMSHPRKLEVIT